MTFAQAEGVEPLPSQLQLKEVSPVMRSVLWAVFHEHLETATEWDRMGGGGPPWLDDKWKSIFYAKHVALDCRFADDFHNHSETLIASAKNIFGHCNYVIIFDFIQLVLRHPLCPYKGEKILIRNLPIAEITEAHLRSLIDGLVAEGVQIDFKQTVYGRKESDRVDFIRDVSAFANGQGGDLIIGMRENEGVAVELVGLAGVNADEETSRMQSLADDGIRPRVYGLEFRSVRLENGSQVLLVRVPDSWTRPHMVIAQGENRFWIRHSNGKAKMTVEQVRDSFLFGQSAAERIRGFRSERLQAIVLKDRERTPVALTGNGVLAVHLIPFASLSPGHVLDIKSIEQTHGAQIGTLGGGGRFRYNTDGFCLFDQEDERCTYTQVFRNGAVETVLSGIKMSEGSAQSGIPGGILDFRIHKWLPGALRAMFGVLGQRPPIALFVSLASCAGSTINMSPMYASSRHTAIDRQLVCPQESVLISEDDDGMRTLRPCLDALWQAAGWAGSPYFDDAGNFTMPR